MGCRINILALTGQNPPSAGVPANLCTWISAICFNSVIYISFDNCSQKTLGGDTFSARLKLQRIYVETN